MNCTPKVPWGPPLPHHCLWRLPRLSFLHFRQIKFRNWAKRMTLISGDTLVVGNRILVPRDRYAGIAWTFHIADPLRHLTVSEVT